MITKILYQKRLLMLIIRSLSTYHLLSKIVYLTNRYKFGIKPFSNCSKYCIYALFNRRIGYCPSRQTVL